MQALTDFPVQLESMFRTVNYETEEEGHQNKALAEGKWFSLSLAEQLGNIGSEVIGYNPFQSIDRKPSSQKICPHFYCSWILSTHF